MALYSWCPSYIFTLLGTSALPLASVKTPFVTYRDTYANLADMNIDHIVSLILNEFMYIYEYIYIYICTYTPYFSLVYGMS